MCNLKFFFFLNHHYVFSKTCEKSFVSLCSGFGYHFPKILTFEIFFICQRGQLNYHKYPIIMHTPLYNHVHLVLSEEII